MPQRYKTGIACDILLWNSLMALLLETQPPSLPSACFPSFKKLRKKISMRMSPKHLVWQRACNYCKRKTDLLLRCAVSAKLVAPDVMWWTAVIRSSIDSKSRGLYDRRQVRILTNSENCVSSHLFRGSRVLILAVTSNANHHGNWWMWKCSIIFFSCSGLFLKDALSFVGLSLCYSVKARPQENILSFLQSQCFFSRSVFKK